MDLLKESLNMSTTTADLASIARFQAQTDPFEPLANVVIHQPVLPKRCPQITLALDTEINGKFSRDIEKWLSLAGQLLEVLQWGHHRSRAYRQRAQSSALVHWIDRECRRGLNSSRSPLVSKRSKGNQAARAPST